MLPAGVGAAVGRARGSDLRRRTRRCGAALPPASEERLLVPSAFSRTFASSPSIQIDLQIEHRAERLDVGQLHLRVLERDERRIGGVANVELIERHGPVQSNQRLRFRLHEMHVHIRRQRATRNFHRQLHRRVADIERQVEAMQPEVNHRVARRRERLGHAGNSQRAAVDHHLHQRLDEHVQLGRQVRDKRHVDLNLLDLVLLAEHLIVDRYFAVAQLNIGNREFHRRARRRGFRLLRAQARSRANRKN